MTERFLSLQRIGTDPSPSIRYRPNGWALCPADKSKRAQEVQQHLPEPLNAKQELLHDEPGSIYQSGSSRRDPPPCPKLNRAWASEADFLRPARPSDLRRDAGPPRLAAELRAGFPPAFASRPARIGGA